MIRIYFVLLFILILFLILRWFQKTPPSRLAQYLRYLGIMLILLVLLFFTATGRLNWVFTLLGISIAFLGRYMPLLLRYAPQLQRLWYLYRTNKQGSSNQNRQPNANGKMSIAEAFKILGLSPGASRLEIIQAHKRLMQNNHPDRGGSEYLATRINLAKDILIKL